jgi:nucleosome assembly protein 1-like 1
MSGNKKGAAPKFEFGKSSGAPAPKFEVGGKKKSPFVPAPKDGDDDDDDDEDDDEDGDNDEDEDDDEEEDTLPMTKGMIAKVIALTKQQREMDVMDEEYKKERMELEKKYLALKQPIFEDRRKLVAGEIPPPEPEQNEIDLCGLGEPSEGEEVVGIPQFWLNCLHNNSSISYYIQEEDEPLLELLTNITCDYDETYTMFTLSFHFNENEYFTNKVLTKKYGVSPDLLDEKSQALTLNEGTEIEWKVSKNLCVTESVKKQKAKGGKNKGQIRTIVTAIPKRSFFNYFSKPRGADGEEEEEEEEEDEEEGPIKLDMEDDYDIGLNIRTCIIPQAVQWFTGEAAEDDEDEEEDEDNR